MLALALRIFSRTADMFKPLRTRLAAYLRNRLKNHPSRSLAIMAEDKDADVIECDEEPLMLNAASGYGYFPAKLGGTLHDNRYHLMRKLGWGSYSSVWLCKDTLCVHSSSQIKTSLDILLFPPHFRTKDYVALKILTVNSTIGHKIGAATELAFLQRISSADLNHPGRKHCSTVLDNFMEDEIHGKHLCLSFMPLGQSVSALRRARKPPVLPINVVKSVVYQTLLALDYLHVRCQIVHTGISSYLCSPWLCTDSTNADVKPDNILLRLDNMKSLIEETVARDPSRTYPIRKDQPNLPATVVSQPIPTPEAAQNSGSLNIILTDFGQGESPILAVLIPFSNTGSSAQFLDKRVTDDIQPGALRAPEVIIGYEWGTKVDIWALGCLVIIFLLKNCVVFEDQLFTDHRYSNF